MNCLKRTLIQGGGKTCRGRSAFLAALAWQDWPTLMPKCWSSFHSIINLSFGKRGLLFAVYSCIREKKRNKSTHPPV